MTYYDNDENYKVDHPPVVSVSDKIFYKTLMDELILVYVIELIID